MKLHLEKNTNNRRLGPGDIDCAAARELMFCELDHENSAAESQALHRHLDSCEDCRKEFDERREMIDLINNAAWDVPVKLAPNVMSLIDSIPQDEKTDRIIKCGGKKCRETGKTNKKKGIFSHRSSFASFGTVAAACAVVMIVLFNRGFIDGASGSSADAADQAYSLQSPVYKSAPGAENDGGAVPETNYYTDIDGASYDSFAVSESGENESRVGSTNMTETGADSPEDWLPDDMIMPNFSLATLWDSTESKVYDAFAEHVKKEFPDAAIIVCDKSALSGNLLSDSNLVEETKINLDMTVTKRDSADAPAATIYFGDMYMISQDGGRAAEPIFTSYMQILEKSGEPFTSELPVGSEYSDVCIVLVTGAELDSAGLTDSYTAEVGQPADIPEK